MALSEHGTQGPLMQNASQGITDLWIAHASHAGQESIDERRHADIKNKTKYHIANDATNVTCLTKHANQTELGKVKTSTIICSDK